MCVFSILHVVDCLYEIFNYEFIHSSTTVIC